MAQLISGRGGYPELRNWLTEEVRHHDANAVVQAAEALGRFSSHAWIGSVDVPAAVVLTTGDQLVPTHRQLKLAESMPTAVLHPVDGDHMVIARRPEAFATALSEACELVARRAVHWQPPVAPPWPAQRPPWRS
jgi:3-oxoadipate enol-lactonase